MKTLKAITTTEPTYVAFAGVHQVAAGKLPDVLPVLKERFDKDRTEPIMVFEVESGRQVDFDLRGSLEAIFERAGQAQSRGPGRPRLGVTSREVTLLPRHWEWLEQQPSGASSVLRRLVEQAMKAQPSPERARQVRGALSAFLTAMAGDRANYEDACRALFAGDTERFESLIAPWPEDIRQHALQRAQEADRLEAEGADRPQAAESPSA